MLELELIACPVCGGARSTLIRRAPDRFALAAGEEYKIVRCLDCGMAYVNPRPVEHVSEEFYRHEGYQPFSSLENRGSFLDRIYRTVRRVNLRWKRRLVEGYWRGSRVANAGRLLDVGCGTGEFLGAMKKGGWAVEGLERNENAAGWASKTWGAPVHTGGVQDLPAGEGLFNVITLWHVLEHLYHPCDALTLLNANLADGGFLIIASPNISGVDSRVYGNNWIAIDAPRHVNHFSPGPLIDLVSRSGFRLFARRQLPFDPFFNALMSEQLLAQRSQSPGILLPLRIVRFFIVACSSLLGGSRLFSACFGATMVFVFQKVRKDL